MQVKFIRDDSKTFILGGSYYDTSTWGITKLDGIGTIENTITTEDNATGDGADVTSERVPIRNIDIVANVKNKNLNDVERSKVLSFFNPKHMFTIYIIGTNTRWIVGKIQKFSCPASTKNVEMSMAIVCPDPYFNSKDNYGKDIAAVTGCFGFPYMSQSNNGFRVGVYNFAKQVEIENTGDVDTVATIVIEAMDEVVNPKVIQGNAYVRVIDSLVNGDVIEIDLTECTITKNGVNCIGKVDRTSSFSDMVLSVGDNQISFAADNGDTNMKVVLYYNLKYLGA